MIADSRSVGCGERLGIAGNTLGGGGEIGVCAWLGTEVGVFSTWGAYFRLVSCVFRLAWRRARSACVHGWGQKWVFFRLGGRIFGFGRLVFSTCLEAVVVLWPHFEEGWSGAHQLRDAEVGGPVGRGYEDLIARVDQRHHRLEDALLGSVAAEDLVGLVRDALERGGKK